MVDTVCLQGPILTDIFEVVYLGTKLPPRNLARFIHNLVVQMSFSMQDRVRSPHKIFDQSQTRRLYALLQCTLESTYGTVSPA